MSAVKEWKNAAVRREISDLRCLGCQELIFYLCQYKSYQISENWTDVSMKN